MTAYKLIRVKDVEKDQENKEKESQSEKMQDLIVQSNLLSGGIWDHGHFSLKKLLKVLDHFVNYFILALVNNSCEK